MTERIERLPAGQDGDRQVLLIDLSDDWTWPPEAAIEWFTAFIAADATKVTGDAVTSLATGMLAHRCAYVSVWGPDCERVHDIFDEIYVQDYPHPLVGPERAWSPDLPFLMTTWHEGESLASALWFALYNAWPSEDGYYENRPPTFVALVRPECREEVRAFLLDRERLDREADEGVESQH